MEIIRHYREIEESGILRIVCSDTPEQILTSSGYEYLSDIYADVLDGSASQERIDEYNQIIDYFKQNRISGIEVEFNTTGLDIDIVGRTEGIGMAEKSAGLQYEREMVWVDGAPDTEGVIILPHDDYDKVYVVKGTKEAPQVIFINDDPTVRPYYEKKDGKTYIYMEGFSGGGGTQSDPYLVSSLSDLNNVRNNLAAYYLQTIDIDGKYNIHPNRYINNSIHR
jgi:hypothetical protein